jgi:hypothetical protein
MKHKSSIRVDFVVIAGILLTTLLTFLPSTHARQSQPAMQLGHIRLLSASGSSAPTGVAIFGLRTNGTLITEAGVPATTTIRSGRIFAEVQGATSTGIALANPNSRDALIMYYFTDNTGHDFGAGSFTLAAKHQIAAYLTDAPFKLPRSLIGTFTFTSSDPIATIALRTFVNERNEALITTVPVSPLGNPFGGAELLFPHFADGGGWATKVVLINPGDTTLTGSVQFYGQGSKTGSAQPTRVSINGVTNSSFSYAVPPHSAFPMVTQQARNNATDIGSVRISPRTGGYPSGLAIFSQKNNGTTVSVASVPASPASRAFRLYMESAGTFGRVGSMQTGVTIANPSNSRVTAQLNVIRLDGTSTNFSTSVDIPGGGQIAKFGNELFQSLPSQFRGVLRITAPSPVAVIGLRGRYNERGDLLLTSTPPYDESTTPSAEVEFPHFISGNGFSTQLVLLSTGPIQTGSMYVLAQDGTTLPGAILQTNP